MTKLQTKQIIFYLVLFASFISYSQTKILIGVISDTLDIPLENANIIANPYDSDQQLKFAIADNKGRYKLELVSNVKYEITVSYIGYKEEILILDIDNKKSTYNFKLTNTGKQLNEVIIKYVSKPIIIKKDTIVYDVKFFANGNERKLKEQLEKLPGVEVDKNGNVTVQGKKVTKFLVEGDAFFGGGTKLGVENIPADAVDKVEVIDHFNEVGFMKKVSDSDELAMNIKLKADKKAFVFGDVEAGSEITNDNGYYLAHTGLFYYSPKSNISFIGDLNNIGKSTFKFEDLMRFEGGDSKYVLGKKSPSNLLSYLIDNTDVLKNKSQFSAINFSLKTLSKLSVSGFAIFSKIFTISQTESVKNYFQNSIITFENKLDNNKNRSLLGIGNIKFDYSPNSKEKLFYNAQYQFSNNRINQIISSTTNLNKNLFENISNADNSSVKQYIEWHKSTNDNYTTTFVVNHTYDSSKPQNNWFTNQPFLSGLIPLQNDSNYSIEQIKNIKNNTIDGLFKHYWIINDFNHFYTNIGNSTTITDFRTSEKQILTDGNINNFDSSGFGNNLKYSFNNTYLGFEYKFRIGKWTNIPGIYFHIYNLNTNQFDKSFKLAKSLFQPQFNSEYAFNESENINFNYKLSNAFPEVNQLANQFVLQNYNTVFKGNALLQNENYHTANLRYSKMNLFKGITLNVNTYFNKKINTTRNIVEINGINIYTTPILTNNPETSWRLNSSIIKKIYRFNIKLSTNLNWFNYIQELNNVTTSNNRNSQTVGLSLSTGYNKWPEFNIGYKKGLNQLKGITNVQFKTDEFNADFEFTVFKNWIFYIEYENLKNTNNSNQSNFYEIGNTSIRYQKKSSSFTFELFANNFLNNKVKNNNSFSDFIKTEQTTYILPRIFMLSISYKL